MASKKINYTPVVEISKLIHAVGRKEFIQHLNKEPLSYRARCLAHCYRCMNFYEDGRVDCMVKDCTLYSIMPYSDKNMSRRRTVRMGQEARKAERDRNKAEVSDGQDDSETL